MGDFPPMLNALIAEMLIIISNKVHVVIETSFKTDVKRVKTAVAWPSDLTPSTYLSKFLFLDGIMSCIFSLENISLKYLVCKQVDGARIING